MKVAQIIQDISIPEVGNDSLPLLDKSCSQNSITHMMNLNPSSSKHLEMAIADKKKTEQKTYLCGPSFDPVNLESAEEAKNFLDVHMHECYRLVIYVPEPTKEKDYVQDMIDMISKYSLLRVGDFANVIYISAEGTERSMQLASAANYVYGELIHEFYHAPSCQTCVDFLNSFGVLLC